MIAQKLKVNELSDLKKSNFRKKILAWYDLNRIYYPWRTTSDPYEILMSEIMLRKTTRKQVAEICDKFFQRYKNFKDIADSEEYEIKNMIRPLGIENIRADTMKRLAEHVHWNGTLPLGKKELLAMPGIGQYSANAVLCLTKGERLPLLDTNAIRVIERVFSIRSNSKRARTDPRLWKFASLLVPLKRSKDYNLAILDLASRVCTIKNPQCEICPVNTLCQYRVDNLTQGVDRN